MGRYAMIDSGVRPTMSFASVPMARMERSLCEMATADGSLSTIPFPGTNTNVVVVPRSIPSRGEKKAMWDPLYSRQGKKYTKHFSAFLFGFLYRPRYANGMFVVSVAPITRGAFAERLSFFSKEKPDIGSVVNAPLRGKTTPSLVVDV